MNYINKYADKNDYVAANDKPHVEFLDRVFKDQAIYQFKLDNGTFPRLDGKYVSDFALGIIAELGEVLQEYKGWKKWTDTNFEKMHKERVLDEMMDMFLFYVNLCLSLDITPQEFMNQYEKTRKKLDERLHSQE